MALSPKGFAQKLGISVDDVKAIEDGTDEISLSMLDRIARTLKVAMSYIVKSAERRVSRLVRKRVAREARKRPKPHKPRRISVRVKRGR